jgi:hypothetical protein
MAWPIDAIIRTYGALSQIFSSDLNAIQNRIVDLHRVRIVPISTGLPKAPAGVLEWSFDSVQPEYGWTCITAGGALQFPIPIPDGAKLMAVRVKVRNDGAATLVANLYEIDHKIGAATTAPTIGGSLANDVSAGAGTWDTLLLDLADQEMVDYRQVVVELTAASVGDQVAAVYATYEPITPTP